MTSNSVRGYIFHATLNTDIHKFNPHITPDFVPYHRLIGPHLYLLRDRIIHLFQYINTPLYRICIYALKLLALAWYFPLCAYYFCGYTKQQHATPRYCSPATDDDVMSSKPPHNRVGSNGASSN